MKKILLFLLSIVVVVFSFSFIVFGDTVSVELTWTAPGDDGDVGTATEYDIRWSTDSTQLVNNFEFCSGGVQPITPQIAGSTEYFTVNGLDPSTVYFFAIKTADEVPNWSGISNIRKHETQDLVSPFAIFDLDVVN